MKQESTEKASSEEMSSEEFNALTRKLWNQRCVAIGEIALKIGSKMLGREAEQADMKRFDLVRSTNARNTLQFHFDGRCIGIMEEAFDGFNYSIKFTPDSKFSE